MVDVKLSDLLLDKDEDALMKVARRVGEYLTTDNVPDAERKAAEALARHLVDDAIERVRGELSKAVMHSKYLEREVAFKIARDVESVACPFLEVTEIFSDDDWQELVVTISRGARIAVAGRTSISEGLAIALTQTGDTEVAETLVENDATPVTTAVCQALMKQFEISPCVLDKLADRTDLSSEIAAELITKVSEAAGEKLSKLHNLPDHIAPITFEAETASILRLIRITPETRILGLVQRLQQEDKLTHHLMTAALRDGRLAFFEAALSILSGQRLQKIRSSVRYGETGSLNVLLSHAGIPDAIHPDIWGALQQARKQSQDLPMEASG
ncbi:MAG: DUF2336 domain-containing protein [Hyphomicrobiales bacterium]